MKNEKITEVLKNIGMFLLVLSLYVGALVAIGVVGVLVGNAIGWAAWFVLG